MKTALFIRTFDGDLEWLKLCLRTVRHFCVGWDSILVVGDQTGKQCRDLCVEQGIDFQFDPSTYQMLEGYIAQQATKMRADTFLDPDTEVISFIDSDCVVTDTFSPDMLLREGRPEYLVTPWSEVGDAEVAWRGVTRNVIGQDTPYEMMRRQPNTYLTSTVRGCREWLEEKYGMPLVTWLNSQFQFSEFNILGTWALLNQPKDYYWVDTTKETWDHLPVTQYWSHGKIEEAQEVVKEMGL